MGLRTREDSAQLEDDVEDEEGDESEDVMRMFCGHSSSTNWAIVIFDIENYRTTQENNNNFKQYTQHNTRAGS